MFANKKGDIAWFEIVLAVSVVLVLLWGLTALSGKYSKFDKVLGEKPYELINTYQLAENALLYVDVATSQSVEQALKEFGAQGGVTDTFCGTHNGDTLFTELAEDGSITLCEHSREDATQQLAIFVQQKLTEKLLVHNKQSHVTLPLNNYQFKVDKNDLVGNAILPLEISIAGKHELREDSHGKNTVVYEEQQDTVTDIPPPATNSKNLVPVNKKAISCVNSCILSEQAHERILAANKLAKERFGFEIQIYSSYRSLKRQQEIWDDGEEKYPDEQVRRKWICDPRYKPNEAVPSPIDRCPHLSGGAVDIRINGKGSNARMTPQDWQKLEKVMCQVGWVRYKNEVWHFEYGTRRWNRAQEQKNEQGEVPCAIV